MPELLSAVDVREIPDFRERGVVVRAAEIGDRAGLGLDRALELREGVRGLVGGRDASATYQATAQL